MAKTPKTKVQPKVSKQPINFEEPAKYKDLPISWQLSYIDCESKWGINVFKQVELNDEEIFFNSLPEDIENDSLDKISKVIEKIAGRKFDNFEKLISKLVEDIKEEISDKDFQIILNNIKKNLFFSEIYPKLRHFEDKTWLEIEKEQHGRKGKTKHHSISIEKLSVDAKKRLKALHLDDIDELFSLRLTGEIRIWGIRKFSYLKVLWFDFKHEVYPLKK